MILDEQNSNRTDKIPRKNFPNPLSLSYKFTKQRDKLQTRKVSKDDWKTFRSSFDSEKVSKESGFAVEQLKNWREQIASEMRHLDTLKTGTF